MKTIKIIANIVVLFIIYNFIQIGVFKVEEVTVKTPKIDGEIRISQISDFHSNKRINQERLINRIKGFEADFIVLTGDIIDRRRPEIDYSLEFVSKLKKDTGLDIYYVSGNHELNNIYYNEFIEGLEKIGVINMDDKLTNLSIKGNNIGLMGHSFYTEGKKYISLQEELDPENYNIVLAHSIHRLVNYFSDREDLLLSGHSHGGQIRLPMIGAILSPGQGFLPQYSKGLYALESGYIYLDSGLGNSLIPIRILNRVQFSNITIESDK